MRCEEALYYWQQELLGQPVDQARLEEAFAHIGACQELCARTLGASPDFDLLSTPEQRSGQTDLYEALGLSAEEEGDAHARQWARLRRMETVGKASQEAVDHERAMALAAWQSAANYYQDGLNISTTAFLREGLKRIQRKRLEPATPSARFTKTTPRARTSHSSLRKRPDHQISPAPPGSSARPRLPREAWPRLALISHASTHAITVGQQPPGWHIRSIRSEAPLVIRELPAPYPSSTQDSLASQGMAALGQPAVDGLLDPFELALWVFESAQKWILELLVRAPSSRRPWTSIMLTLADQEQRLSKPTLMEFSRRDAQMTGWWARLQEVETGAYQLRFTANDSRGQAAEDTALDVHLATEE